IKQGDSVNVEGTNGNNGNSDEAHYADYTLPGTPIEPDGNMTSVTKPRGDRARYLKLARTNAATALITKLSQQSTITQRLTALAAV
ncbi:hypothetical protein MJN51_33870, partial [Salmonella enterica subsp. enterica serovar Kentucky]|nr:hypothetical protein [Salmonella enterica subsp. enterica serovar Kentucky]